MSDIKILQLRCCKKDFKELVEWKQKFRLLEVKKYWESRVLEKDWEFKNFDKVSIKNWYAWEAPEIILEFNKFSLNTKKWINYFKLELWEILNISNYEK